MGRTELDHAQRSRRALLAGPRDELVDGRLADRVIAAPGVAGALTGLGSSVLHPLYSIRPRKRGACSGQLMAMTAKWPGRKSDASHPNTAAPIDPVGAVVQRAGDTGRVKVIRDQPLQAPPMIPALTRTPHRSLSGRRVSAARCVRWCTPPIPILQRRSSAPTVPALFRIATSVHCKRQRIM